MDPFRSATPTGKGRPPVLLGDGGASLQPSTYHFPGSRWTKGGGGNRPTSRPSSTDTTPATVPSTPKGMIPPALHIKEHRPLSAGGGRRPSSARAAAATPSSGRRRSGTKAQRQLITFPLFYETLRSMAPSLTEAEALGLFRRFDTKGCGRIDHHVFTEALMSWDKRMRDNIRVNPVPTTLVVGQADSYERRQIRDALEKQKHRSTSSAGLLGSVDAVKRALQDKVFEARMGTVNARYPLLRALKPGREEGGAEAGSSFDVVSAEEFDRMVQAKVPGSTTKESRAIFDQVDTQKGGVIKLDDLIKKCLGDNSKRRSLGGLGGGREGEVGDEEENHFMHSRRGMDQGHVKISEAQERQKRREQEDVGGRRSLSKEEIGDLLRVKIEAQTKGVNNRLKTFRVLASPRHQQRGAGGGGGSPAAGNSCGRGESDGRCRSVLYPEFTSTLRAMNIYSSEKEALDLFRSFDVNENGAIDIHEFLHWLRRPHISNSSDRTSTAAASNKKGGGGGGGGREETEEEERRQLERVVRKVVGGAGPFDEDKFRATLKVKNLDLYGPEREGMISEEQLHRQLQPNLLTDEARRQLPSEVVRMVPRLKAAIDANMEKFLKGLIAADRLNNGYVRFKDLLRLVRHLGVKASDVHLLLILKGLGIRTQRSNGVVRYHRLFEALRMALPGLPSSNKHKYRFTNQQPGGGEGVDGATKEAEGDEAEANGAGEEEEQQQEQEGGETWDPAVVALSERVTHHWRGLHRRFKASDAERTGCIPFGQVLEALQQETGLEPLAVGGLVACLVGISTTTKMTPGALEKRRQRRVSYVEFLKPFLQSCGGATTMMQEEEAANERQATEEPEQENVEQGPPQDVNQTAVGGSVLQQQRPKSAAAARVTFDLWERGSGDHDNNRAVALLLSSSRRPKSAAAGGHRLAAGIATGGSHLKAAVADKEEEGGGQHQPRRQAADAAMVRSLCASLRPRLVEAWRPLRQYWRGVEVHRRQSGKGVVTGRSFHTGLLKHSVPITEAASKLLLRAFATDETVRFVDMPTKELQVMPGGTPGGRATDLVQVYYEDFLKKAALK